LIVALGRSFKVERSDQNDLRSDHLDLGQRRGLFRFSSPSVRIYTKIQPQSQLILRLQLIHKPAIGGA
jgi:hypothetical protein